MAVTEYIPKLFMLHKITGKKKGEDVANLGVPNWEEKALDRKKWKKIVKKAWA